MLTVSVISPEAVLFEGQTDSVVAPAFDGQVGILTGHAPMVTLLGTGELRLGGEGKRFNVSWAPATYIFCRKDRPRGDEPIPTEWRMLAVEAHWASVIPLARSSGDLLDRPHSYEMLTGSRGWLFEIGRSRPGRGRSRRPGVSRRC